MYEMTHIQKWNVLTYTRSLYDTQKMGLSENS